MNLNNDKQRGRVFTSRTVVDYLLDEVGYVADKDLSKIKILEPAAGEGAFVVEIINRLYNSSIKHNFSFIKALSENVRIVELDSTSFKILESLVKDLLASLVALNDDKTPAICINTDYLTYDFTTKFDCIVGNPPYIRHELIPNESKQIYRKKFQSFRHRADIYIPFFEQSLSLLNRNGVLSFICSNRWLYNQYGQSLREIIATKYNLVKLLNIEKTSPFDRDVIAYPCIITIANNPRTGITKFCECNSRYVNFCSIDFKSVEMPQTAAWQNLFLTYDLNNKALCGIIELGYEIGIGVATGADKVFIKKISELGDIEKERLIPIISAKNLRSNRVKWNQQYIINPYENNAVCDLDKYPNLRAYFEANKSILSMRHIAQKSPKYWYKTIDKIKPDLQKKNKLLLPDISGNISLFIDYGEYYPHHSIYYITGKDTDSLKLLAGILMSDFTRKQLSQIGIRMNGGFPRFQSQTLKGIKIPNINLLSPFEKEELIYSYENGDVKKINVIIENYCSQHLIESGEQAPSVADGLLPLWNIA